MRRLEVVRGGMMWFELVRGGLNMLEIVCGLMVRSGLMGSRGWRWFEMV